MRQRNDTGHTQTVMAWPTDEQPERRPFAAGPGEEIDFPELLAGFTLLDAPDDGAEQGDGQGAEPEAAPAAKPKTTRSSKAAVGGSEGSEPQ